MAEKKAYIARKDCNCIVAAIVDHAGIDAKKMAKLVDTLIEVGFTVERMDLASLRYEFKGCTCADRQSLPLFASAGVDVDDVKDEPMATEPAQAPAATETIAGDTSLPEGGVITENAAGEKVVLIEATGEMLPLAVAEAAAAAEVEAAAAGNGDLHDAVGAAIETAEIVASQASHIPEAA